MITRKLIVKFQLMANRNLDAEAVPNALRRAATAVGVEPISSLDNLSNELADNGDIQTSFEDHVIENINERLENDTDYRPEQFPNTEKYFKKRDK